MSIIHPLFIETHKRPSQQEFMSNLANTIVSFEKKKLISVQMAPVTNLTPVHFFSHGSTMMLGEESDSATYWKKCGDEALANGIKHVVIMVSSRIPRITSSIQHLVVTLIREHTGQLSATKSKLPRIPHLENPQ